MIAHRIGKTGLSGLTSAVLLAAAIGGCGGQPTESSDASVVLPSPDVSITSKTSATTPGAAGSPGAKAESTPSAATPAAAASTGGGAGGWGTFKGQVVFEGSPPAPPVLQEKGKAIKDPNICGADAPILSERLVVDAATKGVKNVLVYFPRPSAVNDEAKKALTGKTVEFDQKKCVFEPHVLGLMTGQKVTMKSSDPLNHNVNVKLKQSPFNSTVAGGKIIPIEVALPERTPGAVVCDIHPWMTAWWMVVDNPYIAVTDAKGNFEIKDVPSGAQKVVVWQEAVKGSGFVTAPSGEEVSIKAGDTTVKEFKIDASKLLQGN